MLSFPPVQPAVWKEKFLSGINVRRGVDPDLPIDKFRRAIPEQGIEAVVEKPHGARSRVFSVDRHVTKDKHII